MFVACKNDFAWEIESHSSYSFESSSSSESGPVLWPLTCVSRIREELDIAPTPPEPLGAESDALLIGVLPLRPGAFATRVT